METTIRIDRHYSTKHLTVYVKKSNNEYYQNKYTSPGSAFVRDNFNVSEIPYNLRNQYLRLRTDTNFNLNQFVLVNNLNELAKINAAKLIDKSIEDRLFKTPQIAVKAETILDPTAFIDEKIAGLSSLKTSLTEYIKNEVGRLTSELKSENAKLNEKIGILTDQHNSFLKERNEILCSYPKYVLEYWNLIERIYNSSRITTAAWNKLNENEMKVYAKIFESALNEISGNYADNNHLKFFNIVKSKRDELLKKLGRSPTSISSRFSTIEL